MIRALHAVARRGNYKTSISQAGCRTLPILLIMGPKSLVYFPGRKMNWQPVLKVTH